MGEQGSGEESLTPACKKASWSATSYLLERKGELVPGAPLVGVPVDEASSGAVGACQQRAEVLYPNVEHIF